VNVVVNKLYRVFISCRFIRKKWYVHAEVMSFFNPRVFERVGRKYHVLFEAKMIILLRYSCGLSIRKISLLLKELFGHNYSTGYITNFCKKVNKRAYKKMNMINECVNKRAKMVILDETFPKTKKSGTTRLAVAIDEFGLIRGIKTIIDRKKDLFSFLSSILTSVKPTYFLSDYDKNYPKAVKEVNPDIILCKDFVHALRTIYRDARTAINQIKANTKGKLTKKRKKEITQLKKELIAKKLYKILFKINKGFQKEYTQIGAIYIEGGLVKLKELAERFPSLQKFSEKTAKFIDKYIDTWAFQMEIHYKENLPTTSNSIESKNSLFKVFSNNSKCFDSRTSLEEFYSAVALMENFNIKTRGKNKGTSAVMRADVDLEKIGGKNFYEVIGLEEIVLGKKPKAYSKPVDFNKCFKYIQKAA